MATSRWIDTDAYSAQLRDASINLEAKRLLIARIAGSEQEKDLTVPPNCRGFGRIRHFRRSTAIGWPSNGLPLDPACKALRIDFTDVLQAQAFQNAACNWRCWYCYVPFNLLAALRDNSGWFSAEELVDMYMAEDDPPRVLDLTGGQPDLIPEWVPWTMQALNDRHLDRRTFLWSDDNLSTDYLWRFLSDSDLALLEAYPNYGRVGCFKGFDAESFAFNTKAAPSLFDRQFEIMDRLLRSGIDTYAYATFTTPSVESRAVADAMKTFVDRLQAIDEHLPLRTVPLEIRVFSPVAPRMHELQRIALEGQTLAIEAWNLEVERRYPAQERNMRICDVQVASRRAAE